MSTADRSKSKLSLSFVGSGRSDDGVGIKEASPRPDSDTKPARRASRPKLTREITSRLGTVEVSEKRKFAKPAAQVVAELLQEPPNVIERLNNMVDIQDGETPAAPNEALPKVTQTEETAPNGDPQNPADVDQEAAYPSTSAPLHSEWQTGKGLMGRLEIALVKYRSELAAGGRCWITIIDQNGDTQKLELPAFNIFAAKVRSLAMQYDARLILIATPKETIILHPYEGLMAVAVEPRD